MGILDRRKAKAATLGAMLIAPIAGFEAVAHANLIGDGDLVVDRVGNGSNAPTSAGTATFLDVYVPTFFANGTVNLTATPVTTVNLPTNSSSNGVASNPLVSSGTATSEGEITLSPDQNYILVTGYDANAGTTGVASSNSTTINREVGLVSTINGSIDTSTTTNAFNGNNIRSAATFDDHTIYTTGAGGSAPNGVVAINADSANQTGVQVVSNLPSNNGRQLNVINNTLYVTTASSNGVRLATITGFNGTSNSGTLTPVPGLLAGNSNSASAFGLYGPYSYAFDNGGNTLYVADNGGNGAGLTNNTANGTGVVEKFTFNGTSYVADGFVAIPPDGTVGGVTGLAIEDFPVAGGVDTALFATTPSGIYEITDAGGSLSGDAVNSEVTAPTNEFFRGDVVVPEPATVSSILVFAAIPLLRRRRSRQSA
jgi:hypothetical protein